MAAGTHKKRGRRPREGTHFKYETLRLSKSLPFNALFFIEGEMIDRGTAGTLEKDVKISVSQNLELHISFQYVCVISLLFLKKN